MAKHFDRSRVESPLQSPDAKKDLAFRQNGRDMVSAEIEQMLSRRGSEDLAAVVPRSVRQAAAWILDVLIDPPAADENIRTTYSASGVAWWVTPYRDRAVYLARKFLRLPEGEQTQVCAYALSGTKWRGDTLEFLALLAAERLKPNADRRGEQALKDATNAFSRAPL